MIDLIPRRHIYDIHNGEHVIGELVIWRWLVWVWVCEIRQPWWKRILK